ncbi:MAG: hypothetical protein RLZZ303_94 [Candidatus Hydrogenedentota bacterium]|jgi:hypothetical protein
MALWGLFASAAIALRGVRWDEDYEFAQVMLGTIPYPEGHPLPYHLTRLFTLQLDGLALFMRGFDGALIPNFFRNWLALMATVVPPFWITTQLTRSALAGHAMAVLFLFGIHAGFFSNYPVQTWPGLYTNGHIGTAWAVMSVAVLALGPLRAGHAMAAAMPLIHAGQWPPVLLLQGLILLRHLRDRDWINLRWAVSWLAVAGAFGIVWIEFRPMLFPALPAPLPALPASEAAEVMRNYMQHHATHRAMPGDMAFLALVMAFVVVMMATPRYAGPNIPLDPPSMGDKRTTDYRVGKDRFSLSPIEWDARRAGDDALLATYLKLIVLIVAAVWITHRILGESIPAPLVSWMPYRLINHLTPIALPLCLAAIAQRSQRDLHLLLSMTLAAVTLPWLFRNTFPDLYQEYFADGIHVAFFLLGAGCASMPHPASRFLAAGTAVLLVTTHQYGAACFALGILLSQALAWRRRGLALDEDSKEDTRQARSMATLAVSVGVAMLVLLGIAHLSALPRRSADIEAIRRILQAGAQVSEEHPPTFPQDPRDGHPLQRGTQDDVHRGMLLVPQQQESLQAQLHAAVSTDMATITWIPYQPALAPLLQTMYEDLYGIDLTPIPGLPQASWIDHWQDMSASGWGLRADRYDIRYIVAPAWMKLDLTPAYQGTEWSLYRAPGASVL